MNTSESTQLSISSHTNQILHIRILPNKRNTKQKPTHSRLQWWVHGATAPILPVPIHSIGVHRDTYSESCHV